MIYLCFRCNISFQPFTPNKCLYLYTSSIRPQCIKLEIWILMVQLYLECLKDTNFVVFLSKRYFAWLNTAKLYKYENYYLHDRDCGHFYPTSYGAGKRICVDVFYFYPHCCMICEFWLFWFSLCRSVTPSDCTSWEKRSHRDERHETSRLLSAKTPIYKIFSSTMTSSTRRLQTKF